MPFVRQVVEDGMAHGLVTKRSKGFDSSPATTQAEGNKVTENRREMSGGALLENFEPAPTAPKQPRQPTKQELLDNMSSIFAVRAKK